MVRPKLTKVNKADKIESVEEQKLLASLVKSYPCLWRLTEPNYSNRDACQAAWTEIAEQLTRKVAACKAAWTSLKDRMRYRSGKSKKKGKSGDSLEDVTDPADDTEEPAEAEDNLKLWEFWDDMKFMIEDGPSRRTISAPLREKMPFLEEVRVTDEVNVDSITTDTVTENTTGNSNSIIEETGKAEIEVIHNNKTGSRKRQSSSSYNYEPKKLQKTEDVKAEMKIAESQSLVELRKASLETKSNEGSLKYYSMFLNLDRMMQKLPEDIVEDLNVKFICLLRDEIKNRSQ